ncbi:mucin-2-like [Neolamprologus brichardi]|uniref:mucin-2-like n=1 Tax=Neolamprologus brichardi TaxID=32507 RepID=UPI001643B3B5|nr:mucin-2-like [Neolamprologus brichardi]
MATSESQKYTCRTFGSGVVQPFQGSGFYVHSNCPFTLTRFTHNRVECDVSIRRGNSGLVVQVEIIINKVRTVLQNGSILVEDKSVSLPYDHTYQHIFQYGIYTKLRSSLLPLSVTWHSVAGGIDTLWVKCLHHTWTLSVGSRLFLWYLQVCNQFFSHITGHLQLSWLHYLQLCYKNIYSYEDSKYISCAFFKEIGQLFGKRGSFWNKTSSITKCDQPTCPGNLVYQAEGAPFVPSCSNPNPQVTNQDMTSSCVCPDGKLLNDHFPGFSCVNPASCPCVFAGQTYLTGQTRSTKCQSCLCEGGKWRCSEDVCPRKCLIEGQFVTTFDGKQYGVPGKCAFVALQYLNWTVLIQFSDEDVSLKKAVLQHNQETYTFKNDMVHFENQEISEFYQSDHAQIYWQSSMHVQVETSSDIKIQVQLSPEIQLYISAPTKHEGTMSGLCGNNNGDSTDDFTSSSGIIENSAKHFALSWSLGTCAVNIPTTCINTHNEMFANEKCSLLNNPTGIFAKCHGHVPPDQYYTACIQRTCNCRNVESCLCVALGSYAKACAGLGVLVGDWRKATSCTPECPKNQEFFYDIQPFNRTCRSLSEPSPACEVDDSPVEGCGCPKGTYLNRCKNGKVCVHCSENPIKTVQKTCDGLSKPLVDDKVCENGCYCPHDQYEDHHGNCVSRDNCTCVYSGKVFRAGETVKTNCKNCVCGWGQWDCTDEPCPGTCQVYGNGHYQTFDSKWYQFSGHCQYTLVEDYCGKPNGSFSVRVESVPCCEEVLTCSRSIVLDLQGKATLTLSDMKVTKNLQQGWTLQEDSLYSIDTVGLYVIVSVPSSGITLIWDKHTRLTIKLHENWRSKVCGLCGNFDTNEMNDLQISGSAVASSPMAFGNSWKAATPPCSDVTADIFPCDRNSYCSAWAQRRCMIIKGDTFKDCHLKVDPTPYYQACLLESCSCEFEGKFLGYCTAVAAYAEACSDQDVCVKWRTPDLCPIYCDYYNKPGQSIWHYEACGKMRTCGKRNNLSHKLEVSSLCENGRIYCAPPPTTTPVTTPATSTPKTTASTTVITPTFTTNNVSTTAEAMSTVSTSTPANTATTTDAWSTMATTSTPTASATTTAQWSTVSVTTNTATSKETWSAMPTTTSQPTPTSPVTTLTTPSPTIVTLITSTEANQTLETTWSRTTSFSTITSSTSSLTTAVSTQLTTKINVSEHTTVQITTSESTTVGTGPTQTQGSTSQVCECVDLKNRKRWACGETWTEDCFYKSCVNGKIILASVACPEPIIPNCPRGQATKVSDGCCETWKCDCQCELYGEPHYISFQGVYFDFLDPCTYILAEERSPRHNLTVAVDNSYCVPGNNGSCAKDIILRYQNNIVILSIDPHLFTVQASLNNVTIQPPYEEHGLRFETTGYMVSVHLPKIRSYVSISPSHNLVVNLAMEHFFNNTQGQCGVCGGASCIRKGGQIEDDGCCDKTAYDWVYPDPLKPACNPAPNDVPCLLGPTSAPPTPPVPPCPLSPLCELLLHPVFDTCSKHVDLKLKKKNCHFDSCLNPNGSCNILAQAAEECKNAGFCIDWRGLTNGSCDVPCPHGLVYRECHNKQDDFCNRGVRYPGASLEMNTAGCFCPSNLFRAGPHSHICVSDCAYCKGPRGEPKFPGEVWQSNCNLCTCNNQTQTEECFPKPPEPVPLCGPSEVLLTTSCCGDQLCAKKICNYNGQMYEMGDRWTDVAHPCMTFSCSREGIQTESKVCPSQSCSEEGRIWDDQHCCYTCEQRCAPKMSSINITIDNCRTVIQMPLCQGQCSSQPRVVLHGDLLVQHSACCVEQSSVKRTVTLHCSDLSTVQHTYKHITSCGCRGIEMCITDES